jgi:eukaryotic-like serine/threonine-protein kinase
MDLAGLSFDPAGHALKFHAAVMRQELRARMFGEAYAAPIMLAHHRLQRVLGRGGMGVVFAAIDERTQQPVALKVLHHGKSTAPEQLKREFRALAGLSHPNLVVLHELYLEGDAPFFTMELVEGEDLLSHLRPAGELDHGRLRPAIAQLIEAVGALHGAGRLHRDLKPGNLMVQPDGRLVVLDFGLTHAIGDDSPRPGGSPAYLAPERWLGGQMDESSDWYSTGVILYEAFTGKLPHASSKDLAIERPLELQSLIAAGASSKLAALTLRLLSRSRALRPNIVELGAEFGASPRSQARTRLRAQPPSARFVGRTLELQKLWEAFHTAEQGRSTILLVHGEPGIGKTTLVGEFVRQLTETKRAVILASRCHEREYIPYNVVDGIIDAVIDYARESDAPVWTGAMIEGAGELARLFPALRKLPEFKAAVLDQSSDEPERLRRRAFAALRCLLERLASARPLVLHLDDTHWGDNDSAELLAHTLSRPALPRLLIVASYRTAASASRCVRCLAEETGTEHVDEFCLGPLTPGESLSLAQQVAGDTIGDHALRALVDEATGIPLFLELLLEHHRRGRGAVRRPGLQEALQSIVLELSPGRRMLLDLMAVAAGPIDRALLCGVAGELSSIDETEENLFGLFQAGLVRTAPPVHERRVEPYHQRLTDAVVACADPDRRTRLHRLLAERVARGPDPDAEFVAHHFERAGDLTQAARFAELAGDHAQTGLALDRAISLYTQAVRCSDGVRPPDLIAKLAHALACRGRCSEALPLFLEAAASHDPIRSRGLRLRAAEMYMRLGELRRGSEVLRPILQAIGVRYPFTNAEAQLSLFGLLTLLRMRSRWPWRIRRSDPRQHLRIDICFELGRPLALMQQTRGVVLLLHSFWLALHCGTEAQLARGLASYAWILAAVGSRTRAYQTRLLDRAWHDACRSGDADAKGWVLLSRAIASGTRGEFRSSNQWAAQASAWVGKHYIDSGWLLAELDHGPCSNLVLMGSIRRLESVTRVALEHARSQSNRFHADCALLHRVIVWLAHDETAKSLEVITQAVAAWDATAFCKAPALAGLMKLFCLLYQGDPMAAGIVARQYSRRYRRHGYTRINQWRTVIASLYGAVSLACAFQAPDRRYLRETRAAIADLKRHPWPWAGPFVALLEAGVQRLQGHVAAAIEGYRVAAQSFDEQDMLGHAAAARVRLAELLPAEQASPVRQLAEAWAEQEGVVNLHAWARMYAPAPLAPPELGCAP